MSSFQELLEQKKKEAERQKAVREKAAKLEAEREERERAERIKREQAEEERARLQRAAARRKEQDDAEKARKAALAKEKLERERAMNKPSLLAKTPKKSTSSSSGKTKPTSTTKTTPSRASTSSQTTSGTKAPVLTREERRKLREDREFGVAAPNISGPASGRKKMSEADRVARVLAAATAGRGLNAKIPEHIRPAAVVDRRSSPIDPRQRERDVDARATANRTGPTYKAHSSIAHQVTNKSSGIKPLDRVQQDARALASGNAGKDRRSIEQVQRELKAERTMDDERDFFDGPSSSAGKKRAAETRTPGDASLVINKMGLIADDHRSSMRGDHRTNGHNRSTSNKSPGSSSVPSKRRRRSVTPSDASDDSNGGAQDFDSDDLDDVDVRRKKKKKQASTIGAASRRREEETSGRRRPPMGGSVLAAAGLDIYKMFGRKDREFYLSRDRHSDSEDDMEADAATIRKEEARAARQAREDDRREEAEERRRAEEKRRRKERAR
ncbi:hypothetical protein NliqN6_1499 [Naganishia liquefaciens]|uniref:SPT2 chromatin protein n=1 Tax=Naganishia liquefaciens TaxID=104408 RepID=A0A8H3TQ04_9TREE|nr:hypothetical protein NliqN6_1499 [Naganishia liquefaciens]